MDYLDSNELKTELIACQANNKISDKLGKMLLMLAENIAKKYGRYDVEEAAAVAILPMVKVALVIDCSRTPADVFNYLTCCGINQIRQWMRGSFCRQRVEREFFLLESKRQIENTFEKAYQEGIWAGLVANRNCWIEKGSKQEHFDRKYKERQQKKLTFYRKRHNK